MPRILPVPFFFETTRLSTGGGFLQEKNLLNTCELQPFAALTIPFPCLYLDLHKLRWLEKNYKTYSPK